MGFRGFGVQGLGVSSESFGPCAAKNSGLKSLAAMASELSERGPVWCRMNVGVWTLGGAFRRHSCWIKGFGP